MDLKIIKKLYSLFQDKDWTSKEDNKFVFDNFCHLLMNLNEEERTLILELTERYTWITMSEYNSRLKKVFNKVEEEKIENLKRIFLFPIMRPEDEEKTKSGHTILYMHRAIRPMLTKYSNINFIEIEQYQKLSSDNFEPVNGDSIFLLDDYLGSGETIKATIEEILKNRNIKLANINILSLASQEETYNWIKDELNVSIYTDEILKKGISDFYEEEELKEKIKLMATIEKYIPGNHFKFGYNESEALITMMRTPDNTFPIFWKEHKKDREVFKAPFSRY